MSWKIFCEIHKVGVRYQSVHITKCDLLSKDIINQGYAWCRNPHSLVVTGNTGRGKTHFSFSLAREAVFKLGVSKVRWIKSKSLDDKILKSINEFGDASYFIQNICETECLFIDDFGVDRDSNRTERDYYEIIDNRWENKLLTIISTNLDYKQIEKIYGSRIASRLKDFEWIVFDGPDLRGSI